MEDISLHIMDIAENSLKAGATRISIILEEDAGSSTLKLIIEDNGCGMDGETCERALSPFYSTKKTTPIGLGLPLLKQAAQDTGGDLILESRPGKGTKVTAFFRTGHIDMKPLGDLKTTFMTLQMSHPEVEMDFDYIEK
jgi:signal transduction histidine kinase